MPSMTTCYRDGCIEPIEVFDPPVKLTIKGTKTFEGFMFKTKSFCSENCAYRWLGERFTKGVMKDKR